MNKILNRAMTLSAIALLAGGYASQSQAARYVLGDAAGIAPDQPRVLFGLYDVPEGEEPDDSHLVGPTFYNAGLLDTGANGILLGQLAFFNFSLDNPSDTGSQFVQATNPTTNQPVWYDELGVAGTDPMKVFKSYLLHYNGYGDTNPARVHDMPDITPFGREDINLGSYAAIIGMPAMMGMHTYVNMTPLRSFQNSGTPGTTFDAIHSYISPTKYQTNGPQYDIDLRLVDVPHTGQRHPDDPTPTYAPLPVIDDIITTFEGTSTTGTFLLDTGAQTNIISMQMALDMGLNMDPDDENTDIQDYLTVGGIGGQTDMPIVLIDELTVPLADGDEMVWNNVVVGVLDIDGAPFDAVFGMNMLISGYDAADIFGGTATPETGFFDGFNLDFTTGDEQGILSLDWNDNRIIPEPASAAIIGIALFVAYTRRPKNA
ncbi:hypothetical protein KS4_27710 [Poriferisphaera corsica]|uniref:Peptidase A2 domain-containing protein n=1 Tax=Poriferisphaera corsica TaxID=2528020 RepID=A0A517YWW4_9BACT|nr:retropepsin-like aspartic protease [Poriferisphaera corsica]QDU34697.1 hypothetical protein KS4_27710 [Poriferisphaera corsica]